MGGGRLTWSMRLFTLIKIGYSYELKKNLRKGLQPQIGFVNHLVLIVCC